MASKTKEERIKNFDEKSARALITANQLKYKNPERAEVYYDRSAKWLMAANELREKT